MNHTSKILKTILEQRRLHPNDILYALFLKGVTPGMVANACKTTPQAVSLVVHGKRRSFDIATYIAAKLNTSTTRLWGDAYNYTPRRPRAEQPRKVANG